jgi:hypothetical protein
MKMNSTEMLVTFPADDARVGYKTVEIDNPSFNAACNRFLQSRGLSVGVSSGFGKIPVTKNGRRRKKPQDVTESTNVADADLAELDASADCATDNEEGVL